jgi:hypothetical protein
LSDRVVTPPLSLLVLSWNSPHKTRKTNIHSSDIPLLIFVLFHLGDYWILTLAHLKLSWNIKSNDMCPVLLWVFVAGWWLRIWWALGNLSGTIITVLCSSMDSEKFWGLMKPASIRIHVFYHCVYWIHFILALAYFLRYMNF